MSKSRSSGYLDSLRRIFSPDISLDEASYMLEEEIDREKMTALRMELGDYLTEEVEPTEDGYTAYAVVHKGGTDLNFRLPIGEMRDGEWDLHYGLGEFF